MIGYKGSATLNTDLMGGHVPVAIDIKLMYYAAAASSRKTRNPLNIR
ncbi:MAG: hypothetical protein IPN04_09770 [Rhodoferax sp.]|nr:hypothetical protein [Rhodoferax sp.]